VNEWYWPSKIARNVERDEETHRILAAAGWTVIRVWEHEDTDAAAARIAAALSDEGATG
jgi:DNA mismatch endonuclease (patch repair protein)